jgi:Niemann-Pick C1 protein
LRPVDDSVKIDLFQKEYLEMIYELQTKIEQGTVEFLNENYSIDDLCYKPISGKGCLVTSPLDFWKMNLTAMQNDQDIKETAKCLKKSAQKDLPCFDRIGIPIQIDAVFGAQGCENNEKCDECNVCRRTASALAITFLFNNNFYTNKIAEIWERDIFTHEIKKFNQQLEKKFNTTLVSSDFDPDQENKVLLRIDFMSGRSITDELDDQNKQNIWVVVLSYLLMFLYISIAMGEFPSIILSRVLVAFGGIMVVILSFLGSIAIVSFLGIKLSLISSEVVPFLVLAIGVDNMFIITGAKDRKRMKSKISNKGNEYVNGLDLNDEMAATLKEVGPSITTAAFSEFLAFLVGYLTKIPALQSFCLAAAFAVLIDYFLQITLFLSIVTLDEVRVKNRRYDIFPCLTINKNVEVKSHRGKSKFQKFLSTSYYDFLMKIPVKITIVVIYLALFVCSIVALFQLQLGLNQSTTVGQNSDLYNYFQAQEKYVDVGPPAYLVFYNVDYNNSTNLEIIENLLDHISFLDTINPPVYSWYKDFKKFMDQSFAEKCNPNILYLSTLPLEIQVREFLKIKIENPCCSEDAVCGEQYIDDIQFSQDGKIEASRFRFQHIALVNQTIYVNSLIQTKVVALEYSSKFTTYPGKSSYFEVRPGVNVELDTVFPYSLPYVFYDQYTYIRGISLQSVLITLATIFLAVQLIMNIKSAFVVTLFVLSCVFNLIGILWLLNYIPDYQIEINAVSVVNLILACGLSVEFTVHLIIFYLRCPHDDPEAKVRYALKNVGVSVFIGIVTTKIIGVTVLLLAPSKIFQIYYFRMYFFLIVVGFFHGFIILPIFLRYVNLKKRKHSNRNSKFEDHINVDENLIENKSKQAGLYKSLLN